MPSSASADLAQWASGDKAALAGSDLCSRATPPVWPVTPSARRLQIARLQLMRAQCIENPDFLALLGALYLEDDEPAQALTWLERALLLDPGNLGAQADHALALAALGEPAALQELSRNWQGRSDLPAALRAKLFPPEPRSAYALPPARLGYPSQKAWGFQGAASLSLGYESNLDRSPRLTELTLTFPEGPQVLSVLRTPRAGSAALTAASLQWAYALAPSMVARSGFNLNARQATSNRATDWQQTQWTTELVHSRTWWRVQVDASVVWVGGALNEPYRQNRAGASAEVLGEQCRARLAYAHEQRHQSVSETLNASTALWVADFHCPLPGLPDWQATLALSRGNDQPKTLERPGGAQALRATGLRLVGPLGTASQLDFNLRYVQVRDSSGYSALLEDNAVRQFALRQFSAEWSHALGGYGWPGVTATLQWQAARQASNLKLFAYRADNVYGGLRFSW